MGGPFGLPRFRRNGKDGELADVEGAEGCGICDVDGIVEWDGNVYKSSNVVSVLERTH